MNKQNFDNRISELEKDLINAISEIVPEEGIVLTPELRDELDDNDECVPGVPVYDDHFDGLYYEDVYVLQKSQFRTIDCGDMRRYAELPVEDLLNIYHYLTEAYVPYMEKRESEARMEELRNEGFFEFQGHAFKAYAVLPECKIYEVILGNNVLDYENGTRGHDDFYACDGAGEADIFYMDGYDQRVIPAAYNFFTYEGLKKGLKLKLV